MFKPKKVLDEINKDTDKFKMPRWWFETSIKFLAPLALIFLFVWQFIVLIRNGFRYDTNYNLAAEIIAGWLVTALIFASGFIINLIMKKTSRGIELSKQEELEPSWDEIKDDVEEVSNTLNETKVEHF